MSLGLKGCRGWGLGLCMVRLRRRPPAANPMALLQGAGVAGGLVSQAELERSAPQLTGKPEVTSKPSDRTENSSSKSTCDMA